MNLSSSSWHSIANMPGYAVCLETGQVCNTATGRTLRPTWVRSSCRYYLRLTINGRTYRVHRLVVAASLGRTLGRHECVRHYDGNPANNSACNLILGSAKDNADDKLRHGTYGRRLRNNDVREIRILAPKLGVRTLAVRHGVTPGHVRAILAKRSWAGLPA